MTSFFLGYSIDAHFPLIGLKMEDSLLFYALELGRPCGVVGL